MNNFGDLFAVIRNGMNVQQKSDCHGLPITRIETISNGVVDPQRVGYAGLDMGTAKKWLLEPGDILFSHINSPTHVGRVALYTGKPGHLVHGMNLLCLRPISAVLNANYALHMMRTPQFRAKIQRFVNQAVNQASISIRNLKSIEVEVPSLEEQQRIAEILDRADEIRAKRRQQLAHLDDLIQAIFHDMFSSPNHTAEEVSLGSLVLNFRNGLSPTRSGTIDAEVLALSAVTKGSFDCSASKLGQFVGPPPTDKRVSSQDFLICRGNGNRHLVGTGAFSNVDRPDLVFPDTIIAGRVDQTRLNMIYLQSAWKQPRVRRQIDAAARTTNGTFKINQRSLAQVLVPLPPMRLQREFGDRIEKVQQKRVVVDHALTAADELLESLQSHLF